MLWLAAITVNIGVFGLFHPTHLTVKAPLSQVLLVNGTAQRNADFSLTSAPARITARDGGPASFTLSVPGKIERNFHGTLSVTKVGGELIPTVTVDLEEAVAAVVAAEYPDGTPLEALKAGAVLARSYYTASRKRHEYFDFCDTTHCQFHRAPPSPDHPASKAAQSTVGLVIVYQDKAFAPLYSASCGGRTRTAASVGLQPDPYPYFAVNCPACQRSSREWSRHIEDDAVPTEQFRLARRIPSNNYTVDKGTGILHGRGEGHGVGLCQLGAAAMAASGSSFRDILNHYYPNTTCSRSSQH
ncbi:MAG: SpoIID/LytB domain-containing protein [Bryobacteraceae bacterium]